MHLKRQWLRAIVHLSALSALPFTLPCLAQDGTQSGTRQGEHTAGLQGLPDHELLAVHGAGLDDTTLGRMRTTQQQQQHTQREKERQDTNTRDTAQAAQAAQTAQSQLLANTLSRQAVQMESALALAGASTAVRAAQIGVAQVTQVALVAPVMSTMSLPLMGMPMLPMRP